MLAEEEEGLIETDRDGRVAPGQGRGHGGGRQRLDRDAEGRQRLVAGRGGVDVDQEIRRGEHRRRRVNGGVVVDGEAERRHRTGRRRGSSAGREGRRTVALGRSGGGLVSWR